MSMITLAGTLPVAALNVGLAASLTGLNSEVAKLQADITALQPALAAKLELAADFAAPNPSLGALITASSTVAELASLLTPSNIIAAGADVSADLAIDLAFIEAQIAICSPLVATFTAGVSAPGISGWSYSGRAAGFGRQLELATASGFGRVAAATEVQAVIIATESFTSWGSFSQGCYTGSSALAPAASTEENLAFLGTLGGGSWNTGVASLLARLRLHLQALEGLRAGLRACADVALGVDLPDPEVLAAVDIDIDAAVEASVSADVDITGAIGGLEARVSAVLDLAVAIQAQLSAGGLAVWRYAGRADGLGAALSAETRFGLPGGSGPNAVAYGLALASTPASMSAFGSIFAA